MKTYSRVTPDGYSGMYDFWENSKFGEGKYMFSLKDQTTEYKISSNKEGTYIEIARVNFNQAQKVGTSYTFEKQPYSTT